MYNKKTMKLLSIIIPVYNLEDYIVKCLDSIYCQGVDESLFEVIAIDDGSQDSCLNLLVDYAKRHGNMRVLSQKNSGVSVARNKGLDKAASSFLTFIDADDIMADNALSDILELIQAKGEYFDVCYCQSFICELNGNVRESHLWHLFFEEGIMYHGTDIIAHRYLNGGSVCGGVYKTEYLKKNNMFFGEGIANGEDTIFNYLLFAKNPRIIFANIRLNLVTVRQGSASHSYSMDRVEKFRIAIFYLKGLCAGSLPEREAIDASFYHVISLAVNMYIELGGRDWLYIRELLNIRNLHKLHISWFAKKQKIMIYVLNKSFYLYFKILLFKNYLSDFVKPTKD